MSTIRTALALTLLAWPLGADSPLVVVDAEDQILGQVVDLPAQPSTGWASVQATFLHRVGESWALLVARDQQVVGEEGLQLHFETPNCTGQAWVFTADGTRLSQLLVPPITLDGTDLVQFALGVSEGINVDSRRLLGSTTCQEVAFGTNGTAITLTKVGELHSTPPYRVELNPVVFQDDFALGSPVRWSAAVGEAP